MKTTLLLARHGATEANLAEPNLLQGQKMDLPLAPTGVAQAQALRTALAQRTIDVAYSSPMRRAVETTRWALGGRPMEINPEPMLTECDLGAWEGLTWPIVEARWPGLRQAFEADGTKQGYLGGENFVDVRDRIMPALTAIADRHPGQSVLIVAHNLVNRIALTQWLGIDLRWARKLPQANAGYNIIEVQGRKVTVRSINLCDHVSGLGATT